MRRQAGSDSEPESHPIRRSSRLHGNSCKTVIISPVGQPLVVVWTSLCSGGASPSSLWGSFIATFSLCCRRFEMNYSFPRCACCCVMQVWLRWSVSMIWCTELDSDTLMKPFKPAELNQVTWNDLDERSELLIEVWGAVRERRRMTSESVYRLRTHWRISINRSVVCNISRCCCERAAEPLRLIHTLMWDDSSAFRKRRLPLWAWNASWPVASIHSFMLLFSTEITAYNRRTARFPLWETFLSTWWHHTDHKERPTIIGWRRIITNSQSVNR